MSGDSTGNLIIYQTEDGHSKVECRLVGESLWLSQALMAELFDRDVRTINEHLQNLYAEGELTPEATIRKFRIVRREGIREVERQIDHYNLEAILAVGFRVKSPRGTQFRRWANTQLREFIVKGFVMDDERLKDPGGCDSELNQDSVVRDFRTTAAERKKRSADTLVRPHTMWLWKADRSVRAPLVLDQGIKNESSESLKQIQEMIGV